VIATDPRTITRVQGVGISSPKTRVVTVVVGMSTARMTDTSGDFVGQNSCIMEMLKKH
jgi:hypothetical protein